MNAFWGDNSHAIKVEDSHYLEAVLQKPIAEEQVKREPCWTEALANYGDDFYLCNPCDPRLLFPAARSFRPGAPPPPASAGRGIHAPYL